MVMIIDNYSDHTATPHGICWWAQEMTNLQVPKWIKMERFIILKPTTCMRKSINLFFVSYILNTSLYKYYNMYIYIHIHVLMVRWYSFYDILCSMDNGSTSRTWQGPASTSWRMPSARWTQLGYAPPLRGMGQMAIPCYTIDIIMVYVICI